MSPDAYITKEIIWSIFSESNLVWITDRSWSVIINLPKPLKVTRTHYIIIKSFRNEIINIPSIHS